MHVDHVWFSLDIDWTCEALYCTDEIDFFPFIHSKFHIESLKCEWNHLFTICSVFGWIYFYVLLDDTDQIPRCGNRLLLQSLVFFSLFSIYCNIFISRDLLLFDVIHIHTTIFNVISIEKKQKEEKTQVIFTYAIANKE